MNYDELDFTGMWKTRNGERVSVVQKVQTGDGLRWFGFYADGARDAKLLWDLEGCNINKDLDLIERKRGGEDHW